MLQKMIKGAMAGLAGTTALNTAAYADMVLRGRPASSAPGQVVEELAERGGLTVPGAGAERESRVQGLGALAGIATGVLAGAAAGQLHPAVRRLGPVLGPAAVGGAAMAATDLSMYLLGVADPRSWDTASWLSDVLPHLAFGAITWALLSGMSQCPGRAAPGRAHTRRR